MSENTHSQETKPSRVPPLFLGFMLVGVVMAVSVIVFDGMVNRAQTQADEARPARVPATGANAAVDWSPPDFTLETLAGPEVSLSDFEGQVVFLNFWATWCGPCQREFPAFEAFMAEGRDDAVILAVNNGESREQVREFIAEYGGANVPILMDPDFRVTDGFGVVNLPVTYVIDGEGVVRFFKLGEVTREEIDGYIDELS